MKARCCKDNWEVDKKEKSECGLPGIEQLEEIGSAEGI